MIVEHILGNIKSEKVNKEIISIPFHWFELEKKRIRKIASDGTEMGFTLKETLCDGDIVAQTDEVIYVVEVQPTELIEIRAHSMDEMGQIGFELGNRHLSIKIEDDIVQVIYDEPTYLYLVKHGFDAKRISGQFSDYIVCKAHGSEMAHTHENNTCEEHHHV